MRNVRIFVAFALAACALPAGVLAQGNSGAGTINKPASNVAVQVGAQDATFNLKALKVDVDGALITSSSTGVGNAGPNAGQVQGNGAAGTSDIGNPVKIGGVYNATAPVLTSGQRGNAQMDASANIYVSPSAFSSNSSDAASNFVGRFLNPDHTGSFNLGVSGFVYNGATWDRQRGDTTGTYVVPKGVSQLATGQISVGTSATQIVPARAGRSRISVNVGAANSCAFGNAGVTTTTGYLLQPVAGASHTLQTSAAVFGACSATTTISYVEEY